jgi:peptidoglycan-N-acetylglucosamine deacetylase
VETGSERRDVAALVQTAIDPMPWPNGAQACVCVTFDVDADAGRTQWRNLDDRLTSLTEAQYGAQRGLERILALLESLDVPATFYVCGEVVEAWPGHVQKILDHDHEIAHHGHAHFFTDVVDEGTQAYELEAGFHALEHTLGVVPRGFRSPGWELTRFTFEKLVELGVEYDSSLMGDDWPQHVRIGDAGLFESR